MASGAQTGLPLQDLACGIPFASEGPHHGNRFGVLRDLGLMDDLPMLEFRVLLQLTRHGMNELVTVWLLQCHVEGHCIWIAIWLGNGRCKSPKAGKWVEVEDGLDASLC